MVRNGRIQRRRRHGGNAVEFALTVPILIMILVGLFDYGWYFFQHSLATDGIITAMRSGSMVQPAQNEQNMGQCAGCQSKVANDAAAALAQWGLYPADPSDLEPTIETIGGECTLVLSCSIPYTPPLGMVSVPDHLSLRVEAIAQHVQGC